MKRQVLAIPFALALLLGIASCGSEDAPSGTKETTTETTTNTTTATTTTPKDTYTIKVYDLDGEIIGDKVVDYAKYPTVLAGLQANFSVDVEGSWLKRIDNSVVDSNYYLSIVQNGEYASVGVDQLEAHAGDVIEFNNICWNTNLDETDQLVDKIIYHYAKNGLKTSLASVDTYQNNTYWQTMALNVMIKNEYDSLYFNNNLLTEGFKNSIINQDYSKLAEKPANFAKWYYGYRLYENTVPEAYKGAYTTYLEGLTAYSSLDEYTLPFTLSISKELGLDDKIQDSVKNPTYRPSLEYGIDGYMWFMTGYHVFQEMDEDDLEVINWENIENAVNKGASLDVTLATVLLPLIADNIKMRKTSFRDDKDIIQYLLDNCFDEETYQFAIEKSKDDISSNQIYAALMAYKVARDKNQGVILFA